MAEELEPTDEELVRWEQDDPYNSILQRKRFPIFIAALRASRKREAELVEQANEAARLLAKREKELAALRTSRAEVARLKDEAEVSPTLTNEAAESCYCVCHSSFSSRAWCEHCKGVNAVNEVPRCEVPDDSNANGTCARALPCAVHPTLTEELGYCGTEVEKQ